jgi:LacI family transcriptional regulator
MSKPSERVTLATIAASAGVSVATVSKVLNGRMDVSPSTRSLVQSLLTKHGYVRPSSRRHRTEAATIVELRVGGELCAYTAEIIKGAIEAGAEAGAAVVITNGKPTADGDTSWSRDLVAAGRQAMIVLAAALTSAELAALSQSHLPTVVVDPMSPSGTPVISIGSTNFAGGMSATQHLLALGHRRIAYLGGPATAAPNQARMHGYRAAMQAAGVPVPPEYVRTAGFHHRDGVREGAALLDLHPAPTAIFAACDETALGAVHAARAHGLRIPDDLSVVGFDDTQIASMTSPPLTTVRQPLREMGMVALRTALRLAAGEKIEFHHIELATELVVRESSLVA